MIGENTPSNRVYMHPLCSAPLLPFCSWAGAVKGRGILLAIEVQVPEEQSVSPFLHNALFGSGRVVEISYNVKKPPFLI